MGLTTKNWAKPAPKEEIEVCISGYFNPLHVGHINYITEAAKLGDSLTVIVNNDNQVRVKGSKPFMSDWDRAKIVENIKGVTRAVIAIDQDGSVCETLDYLKPSIFANGGDRFEDNIPETEVCERHRIKMLFNVGGEKVRSSSDILKNNETKTET